MYYSQFGEDKFLDELGVLPKKGVFVDVGAGGIENSNSLFFEKKGWKVLCIEPDERHLGLKDRKLVDNSVVGSREESVYFVFHRYPQLSGLFHNKKFAVKLPMLKLDTILKKYNIKNIDVLSIDVEGNELDVLKGFNINKYKPTFMIVEYINPSKGNKQTDLINFFKENGYQLIYKTQSNLIVKCLM